MHRAKRAFHPVPPWLSGKRCAQKEHSWSAERQKHGALNVKGRKSNKKAALTGEKSMNLQARHRYFDVLVDRDPGPSEHAHLTEMSLRVEMAICLKGRFAECSWRTDTPELRPNHARTARSMTESTSVSRTSTRRYESRQRKLAGFTSSCSGSGCSSCAK